MVELVPRRNRSIGQLDEARGREKPVPPHQGFALFLDPFRGTFQRGANRDRRALHADNGRAFKGGSLVGAEPLDLFFNQLPDVVRHSRLDGGNGAPQLPRSVDTRDHAFVDQIVDQIHHEERVAFGPPVNESGQALVRRVAAKFRVQVLGDGLFGQILERQLVAEPVGLQLALDPFQRVLTQNHVDRTVRADEHQSCAIAPPGEVGNQIECRVVTPMKIFEHHD